MKRGDIIKNSMGNQATVKWAVDHEIGILYDNGESAIINTNTELGWVMLSESAPQYQTSVEHMTDEQLRESIEQLRHKRIMRPASTRSRVKSAPKEIETPEQKQLKSILGNKSAEEKLALMKKLGMID